jgi:hypothetical protein
MAVTLPREGRYLPRETSYDWAEARRRLEAEPGEWVLPLDAPISSGAVGWVRRTGPVALRDIREEVEYRLRETVLNESGTVRSGTLYARWTPGQKAPEYQSGSMTDAEVLAAREAYAAGDVSQAALAEKYGVSGVGMHMILIGRSRADVGGPLHTPRSKEK